MMPRAVEVENVTKLDTNTPPMILYIPPHKRRRFTSQNYPVDQKHMDTQKSQWIGANEDISATSIVTLPSAVETAPMEKVSRPKTVEGMRESELLVLAALGALEHMDAEGSREMVTNLLHKALVEMRAEGG
jgi:hypothetical protein